MPYNIVFILKIWYFVISGSREIAKFIRSTLHKERMSIKSYFKALIELTEDWIVGHFAVFMIHLFILGAGTFSLVFFGRVVTSAK